MHVFVGHTIGTPEIAGIREGYPKVIMYASESVSDHLTLQVDGALSARKIMANRAMSEVILKNNPVYLLSTINIGSPDLFEIFITYNV